MTSSRAPTSPCKGEVGREAAGRGSKFSRTPKMTERARRLRAQLTDAERKLWRVLRRNQIDGFNFRRQHPIGPYTLDFYCPSLRLAVELDGGQHNLDSAADRDAKRSQWLAGKDISILRFWNNDALSNTQGVLTTIALAVKQRSEQLTPSPTLPLSGGGSRRSAS